MKTCFCCKGSGDEIPTTKSKETNSNETVTSQPVTKRAVERTTSGMSAFSVKSFYSIRTQASGPDDFLSVCSADSFQSTKH